MAKYQAGDKVRVRKDLEVGNTYGFYFNKDMSELVGKEVEIQEVRANFHQGHEYRLKDEMWTWHDEMLEDIIPEEPLVERKTIVIDTIAKNELYVEKIVINDPAVVLFYRAPKYDEKLNFVEWSNIRKVVAKCNKEVGDKFDVTTGINVAMLKAYIKEAQKQLRKI